MARTYILWHNDVPDVPGLPVGTPMYWLNPTGGTEAEDRALYNSQSAAERIAQSYPTQPASATGWAVTVDNTQPDPGPDPTPDPTVDNGDTIITIANRQYWVPVIEWFGGKARITHPNRPSGAHWYFVAGQPPLSELPTAYTWSPGDEVEIVYSNSDNITEYWNWNFRKTQVVIKFGQPVTN